MSEFPQWPSLIADLAEAGMSQKAIGLAVGCDQSHVSNLATGKRLEPGYSIGEKLKNLHAEVARRAAA